MMAKRAFDLLVTIPCLIITAPFFLVVALIIRVFMGSPVFFCMQRPGLHGKPFTLHKFRTMIYAQDKQGNLLPDYERLTKIGRILRSLSLDELPELFNVLTGEMSLVGPRPLLMEYLDRYAPEQMRRHNTKPGITGWAQIKGRNAISWEEKFKYDVWYVDNQSLSLDLKIIFMTIIKVSKREGISHPGFATMDEFKNSAHDK
jgi:lipopolysaccharide/colanic/teichoic acid biosynthesis glycosyltransferase